MNDQTSAPAEAAPAKTVIRPKLENYIRDKSGNGKRTQRIDDLTARVLAGKGLDVIKTGASTLGVEHTKWNHLNPGQQRMLIGNAIRHRLTATKDPLSEQALIDVFGQPAAPYDAEAAAAAKAKREAEAAEKKAKKEVEAAEAAAKKEAAAAQGAAPVASDEKTHSSSGKSKAGKTK